MAGDIADDVAAAVFAELDRLLSARKPARKPASKPASKPAALGVAVSGGGDSTALLILAVRWARARGHTISAATVDHGLREGSAAEAASVAALCARLGVPHETLRTGNLRATGGNLSAAARDARFALLGSWARVQGLSAVLLGHTMDDQAETVLMRLARGSGAEGLSAMQAVLERSGVVWLRPLLGARRAALREVLRAEGAGGGIAWVEDPTNDDTQYDRVKARQALAALAPLGIDAEGLARTAWHLQRQRRVLERAMQALARRARIWGALGEVRLDVAAMAEDEPDTALRLLADSLVRVSGADYRPRFRALSGVLDGLLSGQSAGTTLSGCLIRPGSGANSQSVLICREPDACEPMLPLLAGETVWDRRWRVTARGAWPAMSCPPLFQLGALGEQGLAALRASADSGTWREPAAWASAPRAVRQTTPAIWLGNGVEVPELLVAPLAGYADLAKIGPESTITAEFIGSEVLP
jgi:tRNA(Ile)-lysidine synthase